MQILGKKFDVQGRRDLAWWQEGPQIAAKRDPGVLKKCGPGVGRVKKMYSQENSKNKWSNSTKKLVRGGRG